MSTVPFLCSPIADLYGVVAFAVFAVSVLFLYSTKAYLDVGLALEKLISKFDGSE